MVIAGSSKHANSSRSNGSLPPASNLVTPSPSHPSKPPSEASSRVSLAVRAYESFNSRVQNLGVRVPRRAWTEESDDDGGFLARTIPRLRQDRSAPPDSIVDRSPPVNLQHPPAKFSFVDDSASEKGSERACSEPPSIQVPPTVVVNTPSPPPSMVSASSAAAPPPPPANTDPSPASTTVGEDMGSQGSGLVIINMLPDEQGRFGFNVKGGHDQVEIGKL